MSGSKDYDTEQDIMRKTKDCTKALQTRIEELKEHAQNGFQLLCGKLITAIHEHDDPEEIKELSRQNAQIQAKKLKAQMSDQVDFVMNEWLLKTNDILKHCSFTSGTNQQENLSIVAGVTANKKSTLSKGIGRSMKGLSWGIGAIQEVSHKETPETPKVSMSKEKDKPSLETKLPSYRDRQMAIKMAINASLHGQLKLAEIDEKVCDILDGFNQLAQNKRRSALSCVLSHFNGTVFEKIPIMSGSKLHYWRVINLQAGMQGGRRVRPIRREHPPQGRVDSSTSSSTSSSSSD